jgi:hypothetical protein
MSGIKSRNLIFCLYKLSSTPALAFREKVGVRFNLRGNGVKRKGRTNLQNRYRQFIA